MPVCVAKAFGKQIAGSCQRTIAPDPFDIRRSVSLIPAKNCAPVMNDETKLIDNFSNFHEKF